MERKEIAYSDLYVHPMQMRTVMEPVNLAQLVIQVSEGIEEDRLVVVTPRGGGGYHVVKGHRRWLARMLADEMVLLALDQTLEKALELVSTYCAYNVVVQVCKNCGAGLGERMITAGELGYEGVDPAIVLYACEECNAWVEMEEAQAQKQDLSQLATCYEQAKLKVDGTLGCLVREYDNLWEESLSLFSDNFGAEEPDLKGQALSFAAAVQDSGLSREQAVASLVQATGLAESRIGAMVELAGAGVDVWALYTDGICALSAILPLLRLEGEKKGGAIDHICSLGRYNSVTVKAVQEIVGNIADWRFPPALTERLPWKRNKALMPQVLFSKLDDEERRRRFWARVGRGPVRVGEYFWKDFGMSMDAETFPEFRCETCQLKGLLEGVDLGPLLGQRCKDKSACLQHLAEGMPFALSAGWGDWAHTEEIEGFKVWTSKEAFLDDLEESKSEETESATKEETGTIARQRAEIKLFMDKHADMSGATHPLATRCECCQYKCVTSPTRDEMVPHCQWAARRRNVSFFVRAAEGKAYAIPFCLQYAPKERWTEIIQPYPSGLPFPRTYLERMIVSVAAEVTRKSYYGSSHVFLEPLTGRPMKASENYKDWFVTKFEEQKGELSDEQLATLWIWVFSEWDSENYMLPMPGGVIERFEIIKFLPYLEREG